MKKFAVGIINFFDNELRIEIIEAELAYEALKQHSKIEAAWIDEMGFEDLEDIKEELFDMDIAMDIKEIK